MNLIVKFHVLRSKKEGIKVILFQCKENHRGWFVLISILDEMGKGKSVAIPMGSSGYGWSNLRKGMMEVGGLGVDTPRESATGDKDEVFIGGDKWMQDIEMPVIGGEIIEVNGKLGIQSCYGPRVKLGAWEKGDFV